MVYCGENSGLCPIKHGPVCNSITEVYSDILDERPCTILLHIKHVVYELLVHYVLEMYTVDWEKKLSSELWSMHNWELHAEVCLKN
jgi:hypothetical protein